MHDTDRAVDELAARYARRGTRLHRWLRPPVPLVHDPREAPLPASPGPRLLIGGAGAPRRQGFLTVDLVATAEVTLNDLTTEATTPVKAERGYNVDLTQDPLVVTWW